MVGILCCVLGWKSLKWTVMVTSEGTRRLARLRFQTAEEIERELHHYQRAVVQVDEPPRLDERRAPRTPFPTLRLGRSSKATASTDDSAPARGSTDRAVCEALDPKHVHQAVCPCEHKRQLLQVVEPQLLQEACELHCFGHVMAADLGWVVKPQFNSNR